MQPKHAYDDAMSRAKLLLALYDGLHNTRKRGIRNDWKRNFCKVMHWPHGSQISRVDSKDCVIVIRDASTLTPGHFAADSLSELLRSALVTAVSAFDRYMHERIVKNVVSALRGKLNREQAELTVPAHIMVKISKRLSTAKKNGKGIRPANEVRIALQEALFTKTFQDWREMEDGFKMIGISGVAGKLQTAYGLPDIKPVREHLNRLAGMRNRIVHEADLVRHQRGGKVRRNPITSAEVHAAINFYDQFVIHLEAITV
jgi:hypothetical protein